MMRTSNLLRWAQNNKNGNNNNKSANSKNWIHPPEALLHGHIAYLVKVHTQTVSTRVQSALSIELNVNLIETLIRPRDALDSLEP